jgi:hypothetical protein
MCCRYEHEVQTRNVMLCIASVKKKKKKNKQTNKTNKQTNNSTQGGELLLDHAISYLFSSPKDSRTVIPNLGYEPGHWGVREKKNWIMAERGTYVNGVRQDKFEITATILITNILLIRRVQFMEIGSQRVRKWKKFRNHYSRTWKVT